MSDTKEREHCEAVAREFRGHPFVVGADKLADLIARERAAAREQVEAEREKHRIRELMFRKALRELVDRVLAERENAGQFRDAIDEALEVLR